MSWAGCSVWRRRWWPAGAHLLLQPRGKLDFFVLPLARMCFVEAVEVVEDAPVFPHKPVVLWLRGLGQQPMVPKVIRFKAFPFDVEEGKQVQKPQPTWCWPAGFLPVDLARATEEWFNRAEDELCELHGIQPGQDRPYRGRAKGYRVVLKPLEVIWDAEKWRTVSELTHRARTLAFRCMRPVGSTTTASAATAARRGSGASWPGCGS